MKFLKEDNSNLNKYEELADKWVDSVPSYTYSQISDELFKRYGKRDLKYYLSGVISQIDPSKIEDDGKRLIELADYLKNFKENKKKI